MGVEGKQSKGAQGYNRKKNTRTGAKREEEVGGSGVARGERRYLINTNARSKLFRRTSNTPLALALWNASDERANQIRSDQIQLPVGVLFTHTHRSEGGGWRPLMVAFNILVHTSFLSAVHSANGGMRSHEAGTGVNCC